MVKIIELNKTQVQILRKEIQKKLDEVGNDYGMTISLGNISYSDMTMRSKVEAIVNETSSGISSEQKSFEYACGLYGLKAEDYLKEVKLSSGRWGTGWVYGFNLKSLKYPVKIRTSSGQEIRTSDFVLEQLK